MGKRKIIIAGIVIEELNRISFFVESKGMELTAKKFVDDFYDFLETLSDDLIERRDCPYKRWKGLNYKCIGYKKKYVIAFLSLKDKIVISDFVSYKLLAE